MDLADAEAEEKLMGLFEKAKAEKAEGLFIKGAHSTYNTSGSRKDWVKMKSTLHSQGTADTLDLVPIGAYFGNGKR